MTVSQLMPRRRRNTLFVLVALAVVLVSLAVIAFPSWRRSWSPVRLLSTTFVSPYRNTVPGIAYVGDTACAGCHPSQAESYQHHPMGRSLAPVSESKPLERFDTAAHNPFDSLGFQFLVERLPGGMVHKALRRNGAGQVVTEVDAEIQFVLGSGTRGRSYLINRDGYLFQSPISWYTQKNVRDLSPGFESSYPPERPIEVACLFCHANEAQAVEHTRNRYQVPIFRGYAIGCERCHGPGELHVKSRSQEITEDPDVTIVNPRHLPPALREAVCQQCHLQGEVRFLRQGRQPFDYRPGLPLEAFWSIFVPAPEAAGNDKAVGHVEQMYVSRCFQASKGKMGCISCHDPHELPPAEQRASYYRKRCLECHQEMSCALALDVRQKEKDSCTACHMPRFQTSDIAHTAVTNHRILRTRESTRPTFRQPARSRPGGTSIANFFEKELDPQNPGTGRELGLALLYLGAPARSGMEPAGTALSLLDEALQVRPDDTVAWEGKGIALAAQGRMTESLAAFETALAKVPARETTLAQAVLVAEALGRPDQAMAYLRRVVQVNPWVAEYRYKLADLLFRRGEWQSALSECEGAMQLNPNHEPTRILLITCCLRCGKKERAWSELQTLVSLNPKEEPRLRAWFAREMP
jgi:hypothetical protein